MNIIWSENQNQTKKGEVMCIFKLTHYLWLPQFSQMFHLAVTLKYDYPSTIWKEIEKLLLVRLLVLIRFPVNVPLPSQLEALYLYLIRKKKRRPIYHLAHDSCPVYHHKVHISFQRLISLT